MEKPAYALEVVMSWEGSPLAQELLETGEVTVGEDATFLVPRDVMAPATLAEAQTGEWVIHAPAGTERSVLVDGASSDAESDADGGADGGASSDAKGALVLRSNMEVEVKAGAFAFYFRAVEQVAAVPRAGIALDRGVVRFVGASMFFHALLIGMFLLTPPNASALNLDLSRAQADYLRVELDALAQEQEEVEVSHSGMDGEGGTPSPSPEGGDGEPGPEANQGRSQRRHGVRPSGTPVTAATVNSLGTLAGLRNLAADLTADADGSPFGSADDTGRSWLAAAGPVGGGGIFGGLNLNSTGAGTCDGPNCGEGVARVGDVLGNNRPRGPRGTDVGLHGRERTRTPHLRPGRVTTRGGLSREQVQRVVRRHKPEVRFCYEQALVSRPDLAGRVSVRFVVQPTGTVSVAVPASNEVGPRVARCVTDAVSRWNFPQTQGVTAVTYPFVFSTR
ncbi:MAG: AgmX/PglI C-terminal domain-containing protein [Myxococcota bacterium]